MVPIEPVIVIDPAVSGDVTAPGGDGHGDLRRVPALHAKAEAFEDGDGIVIWHVRAGQAGEALEAHTGLPPPGGFPAGGHGLGRFAAADRHDHLGRRIERGREQAGIHAAFETRARIAVQLLAPAGQRHAHRVEQRAFDEDVARVFVHCGALAAHDAGQRNHARPVGDDDVLLGHVIGVVVQSEEVLALPPAADGQRAAGDAVCVEDVQRPAEIVGKVVGDIDQGADRAQADGGQAACQPVG